MNLMGQLEAKLKRLKLGGVLHTLDDRLRQARADNRGHMEFLEVILEDEIERRSSAIRVPGQNQGISAILGVRKYGGTSQP